MLGVYGAHEDRWRHAAGNDVVFSASLARKTLEVIIDQGERQQQEGPQGGLGTLPMGVGVLWQTAGAFQGGR